MLAAVTDTSITPEATSAHAVRVLPSYQRAQAVLLESSAASASWPDGSRAMRDWVTLPGESFMLCSMSCAGAVPAV